MEGFFKKLPFPAAALFLALAATGNLVASYSNIYRNVFGILAGILFILLFIKIIKYPREIAEELKTNPVVAGVFSTFFMGIMLMGTYIEPYLPTFGFIVWMAGIILYITYTLCFCKNHLLNFHIKNVFPSWYITFVGINIGAITSPVFDMMALGKVLFWFGFISYFILLPIILYRVFKVKEIPEQALPTIVILAAPASLCLAGYVSSYQEKNLSLVWLLLFLSQLTYFYVLTRLPKLLKLPFYPSYAAFTFPLVITGVSLKLAHSFLVDTGREIAFLGYLVKFEEILAVAMVLYVLFRYTNFLFAKPKTIEDKKQYISSKALENKSL